MDRTSEISVTSIEYDSNIFTRPTLHKSLYVYVNASRRFHAWWHLHLSTLLQCPACVSEIRSSMPGTVPAIQRRLTTKPQWMNNNNKINPNTISIRPMLMWIVSVSRAWNTVLSCFTQIHSLNTRMNSVKGYFVGTVTLRVALPTSSMLA